LLANKQRFLTCLEVKKMEIASPKKRSNSAIYHVSGLVKAVVLQQEFINFATILT